MRTPGGACTEATRYKMSHTLTPYGSYGGSSNFPLYDFESTTTGYHYMINATATVTPTAINEIQFSQSHDWQYVGSVRGDGVGTATKTGVHLPTLYQPHEDLIPGFQFGGCVMPTARRFRPANRRSPTLIPSRRSLIISA